MRPARSMAQRGRKVVQYGREAQRRLAQADDSMACAHELRVGSRLGFGLCAATKSKCLHIADHPHSKVSRESFGEYDKGFSSIRNSLSPRRLSITEAERRST